MKRVNSKVINVLVYLIIVISFCIEGYYFYLSSITGGFRGIDYLFGSIFGFIISILILIIYWLAKYINKKKKK